MKTIVKTILGAAAVCAMFGAPNMALGQQIEAFLPQVSHSEIEKELKTMADTARQAVQADNCVRKSTFINRLWNIYRDGNNPFWVRHDMAGDSPSLNATRQRHLDYIHQQVAEINAMPCPRSSAATQGAKTEVQIGGGGQITNLPKRSFLGVEFGGVPRVGLFAPDRDASGGNVSGSMKFDLRGGIGPSLFNSGSTSHWLKIGGSYANSKVDQRIGAIDPGAGNLLLIPGPRGGASGFSLGAHPLNVVRDANYSADLKKGGARVDLGQTATFANGLSFGVYGAGSYMRTSYDERFAGSIPGFARDFTYTSSAVVDQFRTRFGVTVGQAYLMAMGYFPSSGDALAIAFAGGTVKVEAFAEAGPDFSRGRGDDRLAFTGFPDSVVSISKTKTDLGFSTGLSVGVETKNRFKLSIEGRYMRDNGLPVFVRDGNNPTALDLKSGDAFIGTVRTTFQF